MFVLNSPEGSVSSVVYSADGQRLVSNSGTIRVWEPKTGVSEAGWVTPRSSALRVALSADEQQLALMPYLIPFSRICLTDAITGKTGLILDGDDGRLTDIAFSPIGKLIISSSIDNTVCLWNSSSGQFISRLSGHGNLITCCTFSPDGLHIASGDLDGIIRLWDVNTNCSSSNAQELASKVRTVTYSHDGLSVISYHYMIFRRWDSSTGASLLIPSLFTSMLSPVVYSSNGHWRASGFGEGNIRLLDVRTGVVERILFASADYVIVGMSFSRCGRWLVSCNRIRMHDCGTLRVPMFKAKR